MDNPLHSYFTQKGTPLSLKTNCFFYISIWLKYLKILKICDLLPKYPYFFWKGHQCECPDRKSIYPPKSSLFSRLLEATAPGKQ